MNKIYKIIKKSLIVLVIFVSFYGTAHAIGEYTPLAPLPGTTLSSGQTNLETYIPNVFLLSIGVAAFMAFVMITFGGIMYATSDAISGKSQGREYVENAVWGLLLVIGAWVILNTINPDILKFTLSIDRVTLQNSSPVVTGGTAVGVQCSGYCPYSYTSGGTTVSYRDCSSCSLASSFGLTIKPAIQTVNGQPAQMNTALGQKLAAVKSTTNLGFTITEAWPPTVNHKSQAQYDGTSVDLSLSSPTAANIQAFILAADKQGLKAVYEVSDEQQKRALVQAGVSEANILPVSYITAQHFSIYSK